MEDKISILQFSSSLDCLFQILTSACHDLGSAATERVKTRSGATGVTVTGDSDSQRRETASVLRLWKLLFSL